MKKKFLLRLSAVLLLLGLLCPKASASSLAVERQILAFLTGELQLNTAAACGILANIEAESNFRTTLWGDSGTSYGLCQWHNSRFDNLKAFCLLRGYDYTSVAGQLYFLAHELKTTYSSTYAKLVNVPNTSQGAYDAAYAFCLYYERPAGMEASAAKRGRNAQMKYWLRYGSSEYSGNSYSGSLFGEHEEYSFYWDEEDSSPIPGTTIQSPTVPPSGSSPFLPQQGQQSGQTPEGGSSGGFYYVPHHLPQRKQTSVAPWCVLFITGAPIRKKHLYLEPQWEELPGITPEEVEGVPESALPPAEEAIVP